MNRPRVTTRDLEKKFEATAFRLAQERNDFVLPQILDFVRKEKWINLRPEYQRRLVWDVGKRSLFIESLLLNVPIPPLFLYEWELGRYEVMDGQQRLNAVVDFYENGYALKGLERWKELNGFTFKQLPETLRRGLDRRRLSATVLLVESGYKDPAQRSDIRKLVFERLNTGGQLLLPQELRNCLNAGPFNDLLIKLSRGRRFCEIFDIPPYEDNVDTEGIVSKQLSENPLYKRMIDCEIILRFFAFRTKGRCVVPCAQCSTTAWKRTQALRRSKWHCSKQISRAGWSLLNQFSEATPFVTREQRAPKDFSATLRCGDG